MASLIKVRAEAEGVKNKLLRTLGLKKEEATRHRMQIRKKEYHELYPYSPPYIIRVIRSKEWEGRDMWHT